MISNSARLLSSFQNRNMTVPKNVARPYIQGMTRKISDTMNGKDVNQETNANLSELARKKSDLTKNSRIGNIAFALQMSQVNSGSLSSSSSHNAGQTRAFSSFRDRNFTEPKIVAQPKITKSGSSGKVTSTGKANTNSAYSDFVRKNLFGVKDYGVKRQ